MRLELIFGHDYEIEILPEMPQTARHFRQVFYPGASEEGGHDGIYVKVTPDEGEAWIGVFAYGQPSGSVVTGIFSHPDSRYMCVVSRGKGYIVLTTNPTVWQEVDCFPIKDVRLIPDSNMVVFVDYTRMVAYGPDGIIWKTSRLSWDGLSITAVTSEAISGTAWDASLGNEVSFSVNIKTGRHTGGASPEMSR